MEKLGRKIMIEEQKEKQNWIKKVWNYFTGYEKLCYGLMLALLVAISIILPYQDNDGNVLYLVTILVFFEVGIGLMCELLNSKQNRWGCLIYVIVEVITVVELLICNERFISIAIAAFVWIPVHLITFINWNKHKDEENSTKTIVRRLKPLTAILMVVGIVVGTLVVGYFSANLFADIGDYPEGLAGTLCYYFDASLGILGICDGILLLFRFKEAWYIWYVYIAAEIVVNICCGRWASLVYDLGYLINTTYGLILWNKYIEKREKNMPEELDLNTTQKE